MTTIHRLRVSLTGAPVPGGGVATFYSSAATAAGFPAAVKAFYTSLKDSCPAGLSMDVPNSGDDIDVASGDIIGGWSATGGGAVAAGVGGPYVMGTGCRVRWTTNAIVNSRRIKGTTFIVPILSGSITGDGQVDEAFRTGLTTWANTLRTAIPADMVIYNRPTPGRNGAVSVVTGVEVPDKVSWLRTRRT